MCENFMAKNLATISADSALLAAMDKGDITRLLPNPEVPHGTPEDSKLNLIIKWVEAGPAEAAATSRVDDFPELFHLLNESLLSSECLIDAVVEHNRVTRDPAARYARL